MKLSHARIVTKNVPHQARFYQHITDISPVGTKSRAAEKARA